MQILGDFSEDIETFGLQDIKGVQMMFTEEVFVLSWGEKKDNLEEYYEVEAFRI